MIEDNILMFDGRDTIEFRVVFKNCYFSVEKMADMGCTQEIGYFRYDEIAGLSLDLNPNSIAESKSMYGCLTMVVKWQPEEEFMIRADDHRPLVELKKELQGRIERALFNSNQGS